MNSFYGIARRTGIVLLVLMLPFFSHAVITKMYHHVTCQGGQVLVPVYVWDFDSIGTLSLTIEYDGNALHFEGIENIHPQFGIVAINNIPGNPARIRIASYTLLCFSLPDSTQMVTFRFSLSGTFCALTWPAGSMWNEYGSCILNPLPTQFIDGSVSAASLQVLSQPPSTLQCCTGVDTNVVFQGTGNGGNLQYQWYTSVSAGGPWMAVLPSALFSNTNGSGLNIHSMPAGLNQTYLRCAVSDSCQTLFSIPVLLEVVPCGQISGQLIYDNAAASPLPGTPLLLSTTSGFSKTLITDAAGMFSQGLLNYGTYQLIPQPAGIPAGINAADAMLALMQFTNPNTLSGLSLKAADVDASGYVNALDALLIAKYFVGMISSFPAGDWVTEEITIPLSGATQPLLLKTRCYGDVDGNFVP